jgi:hypothetical protein
MVQTTLNLSGRQPTWPVRATRAQAVGLLYDDEAVTLRFMETLEWGRPPRQVKLGRELAEELRRLLSDELEDAVTPSIM